MTAMSDRASQSGYGFNTNLVPTREKDQLAAAMERLTLSGCTHVEIVARQFDLLVDGRIQEGRVRALRHAVEACGLKPTFHSNHSLNLMSADDFSRHFEVASASIDCAAALGAEVMVLHSGRLANAPEGYSSPELAAALAKERDALQALGDRAQAAGVVIAVENMIARSSGSTLAYGANLEKLAEQISAVRHPAVGVCFDVGHAYLSAAVFGTDFTPALKALIPLIRHVHVHDNCGRPDALSTGNLNDDISLGIGDMHAPLGSGRIEWPMMAELLSQTGPCVIIHELAARFSDQMEPSAEVLRQWYEQLGQRG